jgi:hypothetical protein
VATAHGFPWSSTGARLGRRTQVAAGDADGRRRSYDDAVPSVRASLVFESCCRVALAMGVSALAACGPPAKQAAAPGAGAGSRPSDANPSFVTPARWFASVTSADATSYGTSPAGGRLAIVQGLRMEQAPDGSLERAADFLPSTDTIAALELPPRFGGGYLYYVPGEETPLWRSSTWTGKLVPLARAPLQADSVVPGLDRLYVSEERTGEILAFDPESGRLSDLGPLPAAPAYGSMAFVDEWFGAVEVPYLGLLATFDAGDSWHPVRLPGRHVALMHDKLVLRGASQDSALVLEPSGRLHPLASGPKPTHLDEDEQPLRPSRGVAPTPAGPRAREPAPRLSDTLRKATLHGWPDTSSTAVFAEGGALVRIRLRDGKLLDYAERVFGRESGACHALALGDDFGFVCSEPSQATTVYRFVRPLGAERILVFAGPRQVLSSGNGSLVIRGACRPDAKNGSGASVPSFCVWGPKTGLRELPAQGNPGVLRAVALRDGRAVVLAPPRPAKPGQLVIFETRGRSSSRNLRTPAEADASTRALLDSGLWLDGGVETRQGKLAFWVVGPEGYTGVRVDLDGSVSVGPSQDPADQTLFAGLLAFGIDDSGTAKESIDGGLSWKGLELPAAHAFPEPNERQSGAEAGCSRIGCAFGAWLRVGWLAPARGSSGLVQAPMPKPVVLPAPAGGRWNFECALTGAQSPPRVPANKNRGSEDDDGTGPTESWQPLYGAAPRALGPRADGFGYHLADRDTQLNAYAWAPRGASWEQAGRWQIFVAPAGAVSSPAWSTSISRSPWADAASAAEAFGRSPSGSPNTWSVELEPSGEAGVLRNASPNGVQLYLFERGRSIVPVLDPPSSVSRLLGAAKVGDRWYFGVKGGAVEFLVYTLQGNRAELLATYSELSRRLEPRLVRDNRSQSLAIWARDTRMRGAATTWYLYPLDAKTGRVGEPLVLSPRMLGAPPRPCDPDFEGWVLDGEPPVQPLVQLLDASDDADSPRGVSARLLAGAQGLCLAGLRARADANATSGVRVAPGGPNPTRPSTVLALQSTETAGRRRELRCVE